MIQCEVAIGVEIHEGTESQSTEWFVREFAFFFAPRIGEMIWIGDTLGFVVEGIEHGFMDDEPAFLQSPLVWSPPMVRAVVSMKLDRFEKNRDFLKAWGFSGC